MYHAYILKARSNFTLFSTEFNITRTDFKQMEDMQDNSLSSYLCFQNQNFPANLR